jgi:hypothetical protein
MIRITFLLALVLTLATTVSAATIVNGSFEQPTTASWIYDPDDPTGGWTFFERSGVASGTFFTPPPPNGSQAHRKLLSVIETTSVYTAAEYACGCVRRASGLVLTRHPETDHHHHRRLR